MMERLGYDEWMLLFAAGTLLVGAVQVLLMIIQSRRNGCKRDDNTKHDYVVGTEGEPQHRNAGCQRHAHAQSGGAEPD